jgi:RHS repeat-associated protein
VNPFRFSTKYQDEETNLYYYGYRYYNASTGRWLGRDRLGERGGLNLFGFVDNDAVNWFDPLGMAPMSGGIGGPQLFPVGGYPKPAFGPLSPFERKVIFKVTAAMQCVGGVLQTGAGAALATGGSITEIGSLGATTPASVPMIIGGMAVMANGLDNAWTGARKLVFEVDAETATKQSVRTVLNSAGVPSDVAESVSSGFDAGASIAGGGAGVLKAANCCKKGKIVITIEKGAAKTGEHIALGTKEGLRDFADKVGGNHLLNNPGWKEAFQRALADRSAKFSFKLDGLSGATPKEKVLNSIKATDEGWGGFTDWELHQLQQSGRLSEVNFFLGGNAVPNPFR